jgi:hypothetical protein
VAETSFRSAAGSTGPPSTEYVYVEPVGTSRGTRSASTATLPAEKEPGQGVLGRAGNLAGSYLRGSVARQVSTPPHVPHFLGNSRVIKAAWLGSLVVVSWECLNTYGVLPPPGRLFWISGTFMLLGIAGEIDALLPVVNALAIGFFLVLLWQYYTGEHASKTGEVAS